MNNISSKKTIDEIPKEILNYIFNYIFNKEISTFLTTDYIKCRNIQLMFLYLVFKNSDLILLIKNIPNIKKIMIVIYII